MRAKFSLDQKRTIAALSTSIAIRMLGIFLVLPVFTLYGEQFTNSKPLIGLAFGAYGLTNALLQVPFGRLSDRFGRKPLLLIGLALHSVGSILAATPTNISALIAARLIQGAGAISSVAFALVADSVDEGSRATAMAFLGIPIGLSFIGGLLAGAADRGWAKATGVAAFVVLSISGLLLFRSADWGLQAHPLLALTIAGILFFSGFSSLEPVLPPP